MQTRKRIEVSKENAEKINRKWKGALATGRESLQG